MNKLNLPYSYIDFNIDWQLDMLKIGKDNAHDG